MKKVGFLLSIFILEISFLTSIPTSGALFNDQVQVDNNIISTGDWVSLEMDPASQTLSVNETVTLNLVVNNVTNLGGYQTTVNYNPANLDFVSAVVGSFVGSTGRTAGQIGPTVNATLGTVTFAVYTLGPTPPGPDGTGTIGQFTFRGKAVGSSNLTLTKSKVTDVNGIAEPLGLTTGSSLTVQ